MLIRAFVVKCNAGHTLHLQLIFNAQVYLLYVNMTLDLTCGGKILTYILYEYLRALILGLTDPFLKVYILNRLLGCFLNLNIHECSSPKTTFTSCSLMMQPFHFVVRLKNRVEVSQI